MRGFDFFREGRVGGRQLGAPKAAKVGDEEADDVKAEVAGAISGPPKAEAGEADTEKSEFKGKAKVDHPPEHLLWARRPPSGPLTRGVIAEDPLSRLVALKAIWDSFKGTAAFGQPMETQRKAVATIVEKTQVPSEQLAQVTDAIKAVPWDPTALLLALVAKATSLAPAHHIGVGRKPPRQSMQDYTAFPHHLANNQWTRMMPDDSDTIEYLV